MEHVLSQLADLNEDNDFMAKIKAATSEEMVKDIFAEYGVEMSVEEIRELAKTAESNELNEEDLSAVAGGGLAFALGVTIGIAIGYLASKKKKK